MIMPENLEVTPQATSTTPPPPGTGEPVTSTTPVEPAAPATPATPARPAGPLTTPGGEVTPPSGDGTTLSPPAEAYTAPTAEKIAEILGDKFTIPEAAQADFDKFLTSSKLTEESLTQLTGLQEKFLATARQSWEDAIEADWQKRTETDLAAMKAHPELGGDKYETSLANARTVLEDYGTPALKEFLDMSGGSNSPVVLEFLNKLFSTLPQEAKPAPTGSPTGEKRSLADRMFPTSGDK